MAMVTGGTEVTSTKSGLSCTSHKTKIEEKSRDQRNAETKMGKSFNMEAACQSKGDKMCLNEINIYLTLPLGFCGCTTAVCPRC